jgi:hypothetical protein
MDAAAVVRFANEFLNRFKVAKVFCAFFTIYIWGDGKVNRYSLFQGTDGQRYVGLSI